jgi:hypothetical protein
MVTPHPGDAIIGGVEISLPEHPPATSTTAAAISLALNLTNDLNHSSPRYESFWRSNDEVAHNATKISPRAVA